MSDKDWNTAQSSWVLKGTGEGLNECKRRACQCHAQPICKRTETHDKRTVQHLGDNMLKDIAILLFYIIIGTLIAVTAIIIIEDK